MADTLPEGTDHVIPGAGANSPSDRLKSDAAELRDRATSRAAELKSQAAVKARDYAEEGKARVSSGLESVAKMIGDSATQIDDKLGNAYGDYARRAADAVSGFSGSLREKDVEELVDEARDLVRRSPALAIGAAAAAGFVIARLIKAGSEALDETAKAADPKAKTGEDEIAADISENARKAPPAKRKPGSAS